MAGKGKGQATGGKDRPESIKGGNMATLGEIETSTRAYADAWDKMGDTLRDLDDKVEALNRQYPPGLKTQERILEEKRDKLASALENSPGLFVKPRSIVIHGVKVGLQKGKGEVSWIKKATVKVVELIKKYHPDKADIFIRTTEEPNGNALKTLPVADLMKLGLTVGNTGDEPVIKPVESQIEKLMKHYLKLS